MKWILAEKFQLRLSVIRDEEMFWFLVFGFVEKTFLMCTMPSFEPSNENDWHFFVDIFCHLNM